MTERLGRALEWLDGPFCRYDVCLFVRFPRLADLLWWLYGETADSADTPD